jgi:hypothetical protein
LETKAYNLEDFIRCCKEEPVNVSVLYDAKQNARLQFGLNTEAELLNFIGNNGLQDLKYVNTKAWKYNQNSDAEIFIDAYKFRTNQKKGYIAFMKGITGKYVIKSFHIDNDKLTLKDFRVVNKTN